MTLRVFRNRKGSTLITCALILVIVSVLAVSLASTSGVNLQIADNQHWANRAFASAESGLEVSRYWLRQIRISSATPPSNYLGAIIAAVDSNLAAHEVSNFRVDPNGAIPSVMLHPLPGYTFRGQWSPTPGEPNVIRVTTSGISGLMSRTVSVNYHIRPYTFSIFNYGIATRGPIVTAQNATFASATQPWESDVYIESANSLLAVDVGMHGTFGGDVIIGNPDAGTASGSGLTAEGDIRPLAPFEERPEFPVPDVVHFRPYATGPVIDSSTDLSGNMTIANAVIAAGTNPVFSGSTVTIQGVLYIEAPNKVMFERGTILQGMIVAEGDVRNPGDNQINFGDPAQPKVPSNFSSGPLPAGAQFDALRKEEGSCILAPGFRVSFWKNFSAINGVIAASGMNFDWNSVATVKGTLINYSDEPLTIQKNVTMNFDRAAMVKIPAGFDLYRVPIYDPGSYALAY